MEAVVRDADVHDAVHSVMIHTHALRMYHGDAVIFTSLDADYNVPADMTIVHAADVFPSLAAPAITAILNESIVLLEAVAMSVKLVRASIRS